VRVVSFVAAAQGGDTLGTACRWRSLHRLACRPAVRRAGRRAARDQPSTAVPLRLTGPGTAIDCHLRCESALML